MKIVDNDSNTKKLIELGLSLPIIEVITDDNISDFSEDDGGYWEKKISHQNYKNGWSESHSTHQNYRIGWSESHFTHQNYAKVIFDVI